MIAFVFRAFQTARALRRHLASAASVGRRCRRSCGEQPRGRRPALRLRAGSVLEKGAA